MARVIRELAAKLSLQAETFNNGLRNAQKEMKAFEQNLKPSLDLAKSLGVGMAAAGTAVVGSMLLATKSAVDYGDRLNDLRAQTGASVENLSALGFAAGQSGSSLDGLATGLRGLAKNMEAASGGSKAQLAAFGALGISASDLAAAQGDVNQVLLLAADRFKGMQDGSEKSALAMQLFGKSGVSLIPMLNEGADGLRKLGDDAARAGLVMSTETAAASDQLNDTLGLVKASVLGASAGIATALLPTLQSAAELAVNATQSFSGFVAEHPALTKAVFATTASVAGLGTALVTAAVAVPKLQAAWALAQTGATMFGGALNALALAGTGPIALTVAATAGLGIALMKLQGDWKQTITAQGEAEVAIARSEESALRAAQALKTGLNIEVPRAGKSTKEFGEALSVAGQTAAWFAARTKEVADRAAEATPKIAAASEATKRFAAIWQEGVDRTAAAESAFLNALHPAAALENEIRGLVATFGESSVIAVYGERIASATAEQKKHGFEVSALMQRLNSLVPSQKDSSDASKELAAQGKAAAKAADELAAAQKNMAEPIRTNTRLVNDQKEALKDWQVEDKKISVGLLGYVNPSVPDPDFNVHDPFGLIRKNNALISQSATPLTGLAAQPAIPANLNVGGNIPAFSAGGGGGGGYSPPGFVNGVYTSGTPQPQGTSTFQQNFNIELNMDAQAVADPERYFREKMLPAFKNAMAVNAQGLTADITRSVKTSWNGIASTKI